jgi:hypothetical protein
MSEHRGAGSQRAPLPKLTKPKATIEQVAETHAGVNAFDVTAEWDATGEYRYPDFGSWPEGEPRGFHIGTDNNLTD